MLKSRMTSVRMLHYQDTFSVANYFGPCDNFQCQPYIYVCMRMCHFEEFLSPTATAVDTLPRDALSGMKGACLGRMLL